jgi:hypothetical protein
VNLREHSQEEKLGVSRGFTAEISSKRYVKNVSISNEAHDRVLFEGVFGELEELNLIEDNVLEIVGTQGTLRIDVTREDLVGLLGRNRECDPSSEVGSYTSTKKRGE